MKLCAALFVVGLSTALAQSPAQHPGQDWARPEPTQNPTLTSESTLVLVPALVRDKSGELVFSLKADDFVLTDDGVPQKLMLEEDTGAEPLALVVDIEGEYADDARHHAREIDKYRAVVAAKDGFQRNVPETISHLTGGEYFKLDESSLERDLNDISNHIPNRYVLSFQPQSPHPGLHALTLRVPNCAGVEATARTSYWADTEDAFQPQPQSQPK